MSLLIQVYDNLVTNISSIVAGIAGGTVTIIRVAKHTNEPMKVGSVLGSLFIAAFTAWMVSLLLPNTLSNDFQTVISGIAGMSGDKLLCIFEVRIRKFIRNLIKGTLK